MKGIIAILLISGLVMGMAFQVYASDWDKAGKALTIIEGVRIFTGGKVDLIGTFTGIRDQGEYSHYSNYHRCRKPKCRLCSKRVWVPHRAWKKKYIPKHKEYSEKYGTIIVEGHYIRYQAEEGGHWAWK